MAGGCPRLTGGTASPIARRVVLVLVALAAIGFGTAGRPRQAAAHPLGNFTINRYAQVEPGADTVRVSYAIDMAEIPTFQEMSVIDRDKNGAVSDSERTAYLNKKLPELARGLKITVNGSAVSLKVEGGALSFADGQGGLKVLRIDGAFSADLPSSLSHGGVQADVRDTNYDDRLGWKEIVVRGTDGAAISNSSVPSEGISDALRSYPQDALQSPLAIREAHFRFEPGVAAAAGTTSTAARVAKRTTRAVGVGVLGKFAASAAEKNLTPPVVAFLLLAAVFWGAVHAVGPGHGKTVVGAYLVGSQGTPRHAVMLGLTVTATHTASTYLLGFITLFASHYIVPEKLYPALTLTSGILVMVMGFTLLAGRLKASGTWPFHARVTAPVGELALATAGGAGFRPGGFASKMHVHGAGGHTHGGSGSGDPGGHDHAVPGFDGRPVTWRNLLSLGIYGGLIPCPTAIVVLLTSISLNRVGFGLVLVVAFSAGLAAVLTGIGLMLVHAGRALSRFSEGKISSRVGTLLPVLSAAAVIIAGLIITLRAAGQNGLPLV